MPDNASSSPGPRSRGGKPGRRDRGTQRSASLDDPAPRRRRISLPNPMRGDAFGRGAEAFARFMGTPAFLVGMTVVCAFWLAWNSLTPPELQFDKQALNFTLLTLILSLQASYAAPLLLLADNRQADRDRVQAEQDRQSNDRSHATTDFITREIASLRLAIGDVATRDFVRGELRDLLQDLSDEEEAEARAAGRGTAPAAAPTAPDHPVTPTVSVDPEELRSILREEVRRALEEHRS
ncbi:DUF1003 domain-containing protein [Brachybacterium sp. AOP25-B2-12]|uniref:DUF1003 domain-containing protein n=1 Tax=Brachybacterium sp. AOP25-B2-12 TaxID=3457710 RepID=UPI00403496C8